MDTADLTHIRGPSGPLLIKGEAHGYGGLMNVDIMGARMDMNARWLKRHEEEWMRTLVLALGYAHRHATKPAGKSHWTEAASGSSLTVELSL